MKICCRCREDAMPPPPQTSGAFRVEEERLLHALVSRSLLTPAEAQQCRSGGALEPEAFLRRLVDGGHLTAGQARRLLQELPSLKDQQIPGYQLLEKLGQGSMGLVYKARQLSMNRLVAVKIVNPRLSGNREFLERLTREAHIAAKLSHNNIVQAIDVGSAGSFHYFVMEYVEGTTVRDELDRGKVYAEREAVDVALQVAQAVQHAHRRGLIHRDVKPGNVLLTPDGIAKLADLGMARETADEALAQREKGLSIGTPFYMAPEQIRGRTDVDGRADIYSLGATLFHMVTGRPPFPGADVDAVFRGHLEGELTPPDRLKKDLSIGLGEVVERMMARDRRQRYQSPEDLILDLECLYNGEAPRLAREKLDAEALKLLAEGEAVDAEPGEPEAPSRLPWVLAGVLGGLLAASLLLNLVLLLVRRG
jgi:serine/threonine-protein kinase